jgi:predicted RNase H-like HicB family nuclease
MKELIFEVREDDPDGGYVASALGEGIHTEGDTLDELKCRIRDAVRCHYADPDSRPRIIRLHFVRDEVLVP